MQITRAALDVIVAHARRDRPRECCGLLIGTGGVIERAWPARNLDPGHTRFTVDPVDHFAAVRDARRDGLDVFGAYHSHPAVAAFPSETDIRDAHDPRWMHVIVSLASEPPTVRAFRIASGNFTEVELVPVA